MFLPFCFGRCIIPNYCDNELYIKGSISLRLDFVEVAKTEDRILDFNSFVPYPEEWREGDKIYNEWWEKYHSLLSDEKDVFALFTPEPKNYYSDFGYDWCYKFWNSKWNSLESRVDHNNRRTLFYFDTAWSPPKAVILKMSEMFPDLNFKLKYWECGAGFKGAYECENGIIVQDESSNYRGNRGG